MQNNATWIRTTPDGFQVRLRFLAANPKEHKKASDLLKHFDIEVGVVTTEGPLSVDLYFKPKVESIPVEGSGPGESAANPQYTREELIAAVESLGYQVIKDGAVPPVDTLPSAEDLDVVAKEQELANSDPTNEQLEALTKPDPTDKPA